MTTTGPGQAPCPNCDARLRFPRGPRLGQLIRCPACGEIAEVTGTEPVSLDWPGGEADDLDSDVIRLRWRDEGSDR